MKPERLETIRKMHERNKEVGCIECEAIDDLLDYIAGLENAAVPQCQRCGKKVGLFCISCSCDKFNERVARIAELEATLGPFAKAWTIWIRIASGANALTHPSAGTGDFRKAAEVLGKMPT